MKSERREAAISGLYEAATGLRDWSSVIANLAEVHGAHGAVVLSTNRASVYCSTENLQETNNAYLSEQWFKIDERLRAIPKMIASGIAVDDDCISEEATRKSAFYQDFIIKNGLRWWAGLSVKTPNELYVLAFQRTGLQGRFSEREKGSLVGYSPHLTKVFALGDALQRSRTQAMLEVLDAIDVPAFALSRHGSVMAFNNHAKPLIGSVVDVVGGKLVALKTDDAAGLDYLLERALRSRPSEQRGDEIAILRRLSHAPLLVSTISLPSSVESALEQLAAIVIVTDPSARPLGTRGHLRQLFGFSPMEASVAEKLIEGSALTDIASELSVREGTVRQYAKQILEKSETHRQGEFIALADRLLRLAKRKTPP